MTAIKGFDQRAFLKLVAAESHEWEEGWVEELKTFFAELEAAHSQCDEVGPAYALQREEELLKSGHAPELARVLFETGLGREEQIAYVQAFMEREGQLAEHRGRQDAHEITLAVLAQSRLPARLKAFVRRMYDDMQPAAPLTN